MCGFLNGSPFSYVLLCGPSMKRKTVGVFLSFLSVEFVSKQQKDMKKAKETKKGNETERSIASNCLRNETGR